MEVKSTNGEGWWIKMNLKDLTREYIENFAGPVMFDRGEGYYRSGLVTDLEYDEDAGKQMQPLQHWER